MYIFPGIVTRKITSPKDNWFTVMITVTLVAFLYSDIVAITLPVEYSSF